MKPKVLMLVSDNKMGGIKSTLDALGTSELTEKFEFIVSQTDTAKQILSSFKPSVIIFKTACNWKNLPKLLSLKLLNRQTKLIIQDHHYSGGFEQYNVSSLSRFHLMLKLSYGLADRVVVVSRSQSEWMQQNRLISPEKLTVIESSNVLEKFFAVDPKPAKRPLILGAYGRFGVQKGFDVLLKAMKLVSPAEVELHLGGEGPLEAELKQLAQGLDNVKFLGRIDDVPSFLQQCDAVVIPSRWEPWGIVCLEAKAAGKPVIVSDVDGLSEQVDNCGILVPPGDPVKLAVAIASLSTQDLETWGKAGRESVKNAWQKYLVKLEALIEEIVES